MGNPEPTGGQYRELLALASRLTPEQFTARKPWLARTTNPDFDPEQWSLAEGPAVAAATPPLLELIGTVSVAGSERFVVADHFKQNNGPVAAVKIAFLGDDFKAAFGDQVEEKVAPATLRMHYLGESSLDAPILAALGDQVETKLAYLWELLKQQPDGEPGRLLTNGYANIFYVRDAKGVLWAVRARWRGFGWYVGAYSVALQSEWYAGDQVFSC